MITIWKDSVIFGIITISKMKGAVIEIRSYHNMKAVVKEIRTYQLKNSLMKLNPI